MTSTPSRAGLSKASSLALALVCALCLHGCGGGGEPAGPPAGPGPTPLPPPDASAFQLVPARVGISAGDSRAVLAVNAPGAVVWASSDPAVASVDANGLVMALAAGSAAITATSGSAVTSAAVKVYATAALTSTSLIDAARAQNLIDDEQALTYRVFALFGDDRLPPAYEGPPADAPDHLVLRTLAQRIATLSPAARDTLAPFLLPPIYDRSWFARRQGIASTRPTAHSAARPSATGRNCEVAASQVFWKQLSTAHFSIHYVALGGETRQRQIAETVASIAEEVYQAETGLFQRFPLPDTTEDCNGGDGAVDIYIADLTFDASLNGLTTTYPDRCNHVPSYIVLNGTGALLNVGNATVGQRQVAAKALLAHEFLHVLQFAMARGGAGCADYEWLDEATAEWVMDYVGPAEDFEDGLTKATPNAHRSGSFYAQYLYSDHMASIEKPGVLGNPKRNGYADYIFFQYLARKYDAQTIKQVFDATETQASVEAVQAALAGKGDMKTVWPEFALTLWNDSFNHVLDDLATWDHYDYGLAPLFQRRLPPNLFVYPEAERLKTLEVDQKGQPNATFKLLKNALELPGAAPADHYEIQPRSLFYEHLKFSDATVHSVYLFNPIAGLPDHAFIKLQARRKIGGQWQATEDWTADAAKQFCLDRRDERLEELLLIVTNSEVNRASEQPFRIPIVAPLRLSTSNVGCWKWQGTASTAITDSFFKLDSTAHASVTLEVASVLPGRLVFAPSAGTVGASSSQDFACLTTSVAADTTVVKGSGHSGGFDFNLDLDIGFSGIGSEPPDRRFITLSGLTTLATTTTMVCPGSTTTVVSDQSWDWLHVDDPNLYAVSSDGQTFEGRFSSVLGTTTTTTVWKFTSVRE